jgi:uroporphyrin-III C-methyltransferase
MDEFNPVSSTNKSTPAGLAGAPLIALAVAVIALALALWSLLQSRDTEQTLTQNLGIKLADQSTAQKNTATQVDLLVKDLRDSQNRVAQLEGKLAEFQGQRVAMEEMYRELARAPDEWLLAEIDQTLNIASRELTLAGNVRAALTALQAADQRLSRADKLQVVQLRRAITQDMERLKALPLVDTQGISVKLDNLMTIATTLPLAVPDTIAPSARETKTADANDNFAVRFSKDLWHEIKQLIRIREIDNGDPMLLSPQQGYFLRENLKLRLLSARTALIARDETNYKEDLKLAREMLTRYFDPKAKVNTNALTMLKQLSENPLSIAAPDITGSLNAIRATRAARERGGR